MRFWSSRLLLALVCAVFVSAGRVSAAKHEGSPEESHTWGIIFGADEAYAPLALQAIRTVMAACPSDGCPTFYFLYRRGFDECMLRLIESAGVKPVLSSYAFSGKDTRFIKFEAFVNPIFRRHACIQWYDADVYADPEIVKKSMNLKRCEDRPIYSEGYSLLIRARRLDSNIDTRRLNSEQLKIYERNFTNRPGCQSSTFTIFTQRLPSPTDMQLRIYNLLKTFPMEAFNFGDQGAIPLLFEPSEVSNAISTMYVLPLQHVYGRSLQLAYLEERTNCDAERSKFPLYSGLAQNNFDVSRRLLDGETRSLNMKCISNMVKFNQCSEYVAREFKHCASESWTGIRATRVYQMSVACATLFQEGRVVLPLKEVREYVEHKVERWTQIQRRWEKFVPPMDPEEPDLRSDKAFIDLIPGPEK